MFDINNLDNVINSRDIVSRIEILETLPHPTKEKLGLQEEEELQALKVIIEQIDFNTNSDDGVVLIRDSFLEEYIIGELDEYIPDIPSFIVINYDATIINFKIDYASIDIAGDTYWFK